MKNTHVGWAGIYRFQYLQSLNWWNENMEAFNEYLKFVKKMKLEIKRTIALQPLFKGLGGVFLTKECPYTKAKNVVIPRWNRPIIEKKQRLP